jgi:hypothetical protein
MNTSIIRPNRVPSSAGSVFADTNQFIMMLIKVIKEPLSYFGAVCASLISRRENAVAANFFEK